MGPDTIALKRMKYLGINFTKEVQDLYSKTSWEEINEDLKERNSILCLLTERQYCYNDSIHQVDLQIQESLSKCHTHKLKKLTTNSKVHPLLGISPEKTIIKKKYMPPNAHCSIIYNSQHMKLPKCPSTEEWIKKIWYPNTVEYYSATK